MINRCIDPPMPGFLPDSPALGYRQHRYMARDDADTPWQTAIAAQLATGHQYP
ncbi:hypothetical protein [Bradyrhizobium sp. RDI18]|uniref:hypothetical protein n=1 Tax=Bradyrhizobium sp. RDI18 TaxID=3367400 RepID=UPI000AEE68D5